MRKLAGVIAGLLAVGIAIGLGTSGAKAASSDVVVTGPGPGAAPNVRTFGADGKSGGVSFDANGSATSGVSVASGDINGDGTADIVTGTGPGVNAQVQVWSHDGNTLIAQANPFPGFQGGISVAAANEDETPQLEVIVAAGPGGGPHVKVLRVSGGQLVEEYSFMAYDPGFRGGVSVAGSGGRIITGAGPGGGPHVRVFHISQGQVSVESEWMAYDPHFTGGVHVAAGAVRTPTGVDVVTGAGAGGGPHVKLWTLGGAEGPGLMAYDPKFSGGVFVAVGQGQKLITGAGAGGGPHVKLLTYANNAFSAVAQFMAYDPNFTGGVHVGGFPASTVPPTTTTACTGIPPICLPGGGGGSTTTSTTTHATTTSTTTHATTTTAAPTTTTSTTAAGGGLPIPIP
ncbi:MAG TPA: FG-GAP repeat protein [Acidimicrobiales bacterium]|nr:FG-GAP repeat protein [Acidimicrobiales bacterium]